MSKITSKLDQKELMGGNVTQAQKDKKEESKKTGDEEIDESKLSKKELNKLKAKQAKAAAKASGKGGEQPEGAEKKAPVKESKKSVPKAADPVMKAKEASKDDLSVLSKYEKMLGTS